MNKKMLQLVSFGFVIILIAGCKGGKGNIGRLIAYHIPSQEAQWIRNGDPIEFEGELWYPADGIETLLDSEVYLMGEYKSVQFFTDKLDIRPYDRLYTKFDKNKFRYFLKK